MIGILLAAVSFLNWKWAVGIVAVVAGVPVLLGDVSVTLDTPLMSIPGMLAGWYWDQIVTLLGEAVNQALSGVLPESWI